MTEVRSVLLVGLLVSSLALAPVAAAGSVHTPAPGTAQPAATADAVVASSAAGLAQEECSYPVTLTDTTGTEVTLGEPPERVVALQPSDAQTLWAIGAQERVVGMPVTQYTDYLDDRDQTTNVKNEDGSVNVEQVVGLNPDVVIAANATRIETVRQLRDAGLTVYHFETTESLAGIRENIETIGQLAGKCAGAADTAASFQERVETVQRASEMADDRPSVLYYFFSFTTGDGTHIHDVIETAGGENVAASAGLSGYQSLSAEIVADRNPEWIVYPDDASVPTGAPYNGTTAVQENQTVALRRNYISQPGPRVVIPLTRLARTWHPEALERANESMATTTTTAPQTTTDAATSVDDTTSTSTSGSPTPTSGSGPGFGPLVALGSLVATALLVRRRDR
jgi:iron complex transport system substrate-binding protein